MVDDHDPWERFAPWEGTYRAPRWRRSSGSARSGRVRRVGDAVLAAVVVSVAVDLAVRVVVALLHGDLLALLGVLLAPANALLLWGLAWWRWPPQTAVARSALSVRSGLWRTRTAAWEDVVDVQRPGRFEEHPVALLAGGERMALVALPVVLADQMAAVARPVGPPPSGAPGPREPGREDLEGPFRRGRSVR